MAARTSEVGQMNIRIDKRLKEEGDAVFAAMDMTPSQAVRALYEFAVKHRYEPDLIIKNIECKQKDKTDAEEIERKLRLVQEGLEIIPNFFKTYGLEYPSESANEFLKRPWKEIVAEEIWERYENMERA